jgi:hypothetical protein
VHCCVLYARHEGSQEDVLSRLKASSVQVFSDRGINSDNVPVSPLLVVGAVHNHLVARRLRSKTALVVDSGEPREVHHFCTLLGYGADAVCPYLAFESLRALQKDRKLAPAGTFAEVEVRCCLRSLCLRHTICSFLGGFHSLVLLVVV